MRACVCVCVLCKFKAHKRCAVRAPTNCKWTALASIGKDIIEDEDGISMPHQWMEGNLPVSAKCAVCDKTCGSVLRLQDYRCLWCRAMCQIGVLPFGTGNDLARVLGWGAAFDDDTQLPAALEKLEHSQIKMLDRWSIWTYEGNMPPPRKLSQQMDPISEYEDSVADHLSKILHCEDHQVIISSAKVLCETVKAFVAKVAQAHENDSEKDSKDIATKCAVLNEKLESLLKTLNQESEASIKTEEMVEEEEVKVEDTPQIVGSPDLDTLPGMMAAGMKPKPVFKARDALMSRANSLKKAVRQIIEHTEKAVDEQNAQTLELLSDNRQLEATKSSSSLEASRSAPSFSVFADEPEPESEKPPPVLLQPPGISSSIAKTLAGGSFISKVLLANADALCAAASPLLEQDIPLSRTKNLMWYGVLGGKEMINQTFKNLDQRVLLECDGQRIPLPSLQGIVIMNIPSYSGGTNFGEDPNKMSFDDKILEVVAVFGGMQIAVSRLMTSSIIELHSVKVASKNNSTVEQELYSLAQRASECLDRLYPAGKLAEPTLRSQVADLVQSVRVLHHRASTFLIEKAPSLHLWPDLEEKLSNALLSLELELRKAAEIAGLPHIAQALEESSLLEQQKRSKATSRHKPGFVRLKGKGKEKERGAAASLPPAFDIRSWTVEEVGAWLESLSLGEYRANFISHEIRGAELLNLERRDLKDLGVTKVGHLKRIQQAIKELHHREAAYDRPST
nr:hypothetical protein BaRGS_030484 [Batillaria attramentaria]